jgi:hemoglobin
MAEERIDGEPRVVLAPGHMGTSDHQAPRQTDYHLLDTVLAARWAETPAERIQRVERVGWAVARELGFTPRSLPSLTADESVAQLSGLFAELGFEPELTRGGQDLQIRLHACPLRPSPRSTQRSCARFTCACSDLGRAGSGHGECPGTLRRAAPVRGAQHFPRGVGAGCGRARIRRAREATMTAGIATPVQMAAPQRAVDLGLAVARRSPYRGDARRCSGGPTRHAGRGMIAGAPSRDIADREDITGLVSTFYRRAFADDILGPIFVDIAQMDLSAHLPVMCDFWESVLFRAGLYHRNALQPHLGLNTKIELTPAHFARWVDLWTATVDERHTGEKAEFAKVQVTRIASSIIRRLRGQSATELLTIQCSPPDQR